MNATATPTAGRADGARRLPGPGRLYSLRRLPLVRRDVVAFLEELQRGWGNVVQFGGRWRRFYFVNEPEIVHEILVTRAADFSKDRGLQMAKRILGEGLLTSEGAFHRRQRRLASPAFHHQRIANYAESMVRYARRTAGEWRDGQRVDMDREMMRLTLAIVAKTLFDAEVDDEADDIARSLDTVMELFPRVANPFGALLNALPLPSTRRFDAATRRIDATVFRMVRARRAEGVDRGDLLSMLLAAQDEDDGSVMTDRQVRDEAITLFLAGHETTANALMWTWYLLSGHPEVEARLHAELDEVLAADDPGPAVELARRLPYTRQVLAESMRLFPPAHSLGRRALREFRIGDHVVPAGSTVLMSPWLMHRDPRFWPDPERFDPDRWTAERAAERPRFAYFPFGGGPRICIGESFAWTEGILVLATLAHRWTARLVPGHPVERQPVITLRARHGMAMTLHARG